MDISDLSQWDKPVFPVTIVAKAAGIKASALRMWFIRKQIPRADPHELPESLGKPFGAEPQKDGLPRFLTYRGMLMLTVAAALTKHGVITRDAVQAAYKWVHTSSYEGGQVCRLPGQLFSGTTGTYLAYSAGSPAEVLAGQATKGGGLTLPIQRYLKGYKAGRNPVVTLVYLDEIVASVADVATKYLWDTGKVADE